MCMTMNIVDMLKELVSIRSEVYIRNGKIHRENYEEIADKIAEIANKLGLSADIRRLRVNGESIPVVMVKMEGHGSTIALVSHYDVVPAKGPWLVDGVEMDPYTPVVIDGKVYGRGSADDKSAIVASLLALGELNEAKRPLKYNPTVVVVGDEEIGGVGVRRLLDEGFKWDKVLILDSSADFLSVGASGVVHGWIKVKGRGGHAGYPHLCKNPVEDACRLVTKLCEEYKAIRANKLSKFNSPPNSPFPKVWGRISFTIMKLGSKEAEKHNIIPSEAIIGFDLRLIPEEDEAEAVNEFIDYVQHISLQLKVETDIEVLSLQRGWYTTDEEYIDEAKEALRRAMKTTMDKEDVKIAAELGGNDGTFFFKKGMPTIAFGAIRPDNNIHTEGEFVYIKDIVLLKEFIKELLILT